MSDFIKSSIAYPLKLDGLSDVFMKLDKKELKALTQVIANISEMSYRRGVQQALALDARGSLEHFNKETVLHEFRYGTPATLSPGIDWVDLKTNKWAKERVTSVSRLDIEYGVTLSNLGFRIDGRL